MRIGDLTVNTPVLLAPMAAVTDLPFRTVCEEFGVGFTITEFLSAHALAVGARMTAGSTVRVSPIRMGCGSYQSQRRSAKRFTL